ncbi:MAG TPA: hypothetical protein PKC25_04860 [Candidatus Rifleibacterium sp.]|nr:hypothetical protein [Candidatus Rifleibacterium sp.]
MKRLIYLFYFCVLLTAVSWRLASASSDLPELQSVRLHEASVGTDLVFSFNRMVRPATRFSGQENCLTLDFADASIAEQLAEKAFAGRDLKLGWLASLPPRENLVRARLYIQPHCLAAVRYSGENVIVRLTEKTQVKSDENSDDRKLLNPHEDKNSPAVVSLQEAPFRPAVEELASQAGIELRLSGNLPEAFSLELEASSPVEALQAIADVCNLRFYREGKVWFMAGV